MSLPIVWDGVEIPYRISTEDPRRIQIVVQGERKRCVDIETPLELDRTYEGKGFQVHFLAAPDIKENDVRQFVSKNGTRIGWLIPVLSLVSNLHDFGENRHFLRYAYIALRDALSSASNEIYARRVDIGLKDSFAITDFFHESTVLLLISTETLVSGGEFDLLRAIPSLVKYGYLPLGPESPDLYSFDFVELPKEQVKYLLSSEEVGEHEVVASLLKSYASSHKDPVIEFFYVYQILELLMEKVFSIEQSSMAEGIIAAGSNSAKVKAALEKASEFVSEKRRIRMLAEKYCDIEGELSEVRAAANDMLRRLQMDVGSNFSDTVYPVRNFVFHQYRSFPADGLPILKEVTAELLSVLPLMLSRFGVASKSAGAIDRVD